MPATPALLVRFHPGERDAAVEEARRILAAIGEPDALIRDAEAPGHLKIIPEGDPHEAQAAVAGLAHDAPTVFRFTANWTVADQFVHGDLDSIRRAVAAYQADIGRHDTWKVAVRCRDSDLLAQDVIDAVAPLLQDRRVDLQNPTKEIRIDILGDEAAIGLLNRDEFFRAEA